MRTILTLLISVFLITSLFAQTTEGEKKLRSASNDTILGWKKGGIFTLNFSQAKFENWAAGGLNSMGLNGLLSVYARYKAKTYTWDNSLDLGYGIIKQGEDAEFIKNDDKVDLMSKFGKKASRKWYYAALLNFKTQMTNGYKYPNDSVAISKLLAPGYILGAIGMDFKNDNYSLFISPATSKTTLVLDETFSNAGAFGVDSGKVVRAEFGGYLRAQFKYDIMKNVTFSTKMDLFSNYLNEPKNIDVNVEALLSLKVNKYISATIFANLLYDHDIDIAWTDKDGKEHFGPTTQFKELLGVGFSYKF